MRTVGLEKLTPSGHIEDNRNGGKHKKNYLMCLCKWLTEQSRGDIPERQTLRRATHGRMLGRPMSTHVLKGHGT